MPKTFIHILFIAIALVSVSFLFDFTTAAVADTSTAISTGDASHIQNSKAFNTASGKDVAPAYTGRLNK